MNSEPDPIQPRSPPTPAAVIHPGCVVGMVEPSRRGVYAIRHYAAGEIVVGGHVDAEFPRDRQTHTQLTIDEVQRGGGLMSRVAHSCAPNCGVRLNQVGTHDLIARYSVRPGEEITIDFAMRSFSMDLFPARCQCGTATCRGVITGFADLPSDRKLAYRGLVAPHLLALDTASHYCPSGG